MFSLNKLDEVFKTKSAVSLGDILATSFVYHDRYFVLVPAHGGFRSLVEPATEIHASLVLVLDDYARYSENVTVAVSSRSGSDSGGETVVIQVINRRCLELRSLSP